MQINELVKQDKIIMAVKDEESLAQALTCAPRVIFLLKSDISTAKDVVARCKAAGKTAFVHLDLMEGIGKDEAAIRFLAEQVVPDGIVTTKASLVRFAKAAGLQTVFRVFLIDSQSLESAFHTLQKLTPDAVEIMPGIMGEVTKKFASRYPSPIAGGMVSTKEQVLKQLASGALGVSTSAKELW